MDVFLVEDLGRQRLPSRSLVAVLQRAGWRARLAHFSGAPAEADNVVVSARQECPPLMVFSIHFADHVADCLALITALRESGADAHMTMAGPLPAMATTELLDACPALDSVLWGEAEANIVQLAACADDPARWQIIPGLTCRQNPVRTVGPQHVVVPQLDELPDPAHQEEMPTWSGYGFATVESSRGCYHACTFCLPCAFYRALGVPYRQKSVNRVVQEIETLYRQGARLFLFDDEQFLAPGRARASRVDALARALDERSRRIAFTLKCRADDVDAALFGRLQAMGLVRVYVGIESGCPATLDVLGKGVTVERNVEALATLDELGIVADFRSLLFHPWSTLEMIEADLDFMERVLPYVSTGLDLREVEVYPGTPMAARLQSEGRGSEAPGSRSYTLADPRAELLRRLNRIVFSPAGIHAGLRAVLAEAWFSFALQRRFEAAGSCERGRQLTDVARRINTVAVDMSREMLAFVRHGDLYDADEVHARAAAWIARVNASSGIVAETLQPDRRWNLPPDRFL